MTDNADKSQPASATLPTEKGMKLFGGSEYQLANSNRVAQVMETLWYGPCSDAERRETIQKAVGQTLAGISPKDDIEGMLAVQMVATNAAAMECFRRAMLPDQTSERRAQNLKFADKLSRTYTMQMDALQRYRGKGQQQVTVVHQHVQVAGGQVAISGTIDSKPGGGGGAEKIKEQPHAKQIDYQPPVYAPMPAMPCTDAAREAVPVAGDAERTMPDARRHVAGRTEG